MRPMTDDAASFLSKPQLYGGFGGFSRDAFFVRRQRQRMNLVAVCQCLFFPWITFCLVFAVVSFNLHYSMPWLCWLIVAAFALIVSALGGGAFVSIRAKMRDNESH